MKIPCSNCNQRLEIPEELAGQTIECPACNASLAVPAIAAPTSIPAQVQESAPQAASSKKSKSSVPKWTIASIAGIAVVVVGLIMFFPDTAVKTDDESQRPSPQAEATPVELVAEASQPKPPTAKAPDISIHDAAMLGKIEAIKQHLSAGADVNAKDAESILEGTPLHKAAIVANKEIAELLISKGADVNAKDKYEKTPLHNAIGNGLRKGHKETVELLIAKGADVNAKTKRGETPLDAAITYNPKITDLLRKHGGKTAEELKAAGK
jgi:hypothetical protein